MWQRVRVQSCAMMLRESRELFFSLYTDQITDENFQFTVTARLRKSRNFFSYSATLVDWEQNIVHSNKSTKITESQRRTFWSILYAGKENTRVKFFDFNFFSLSLKKSLFAGSRKTVDDCRCWQFWLQMATKRLRSNRIKFY